MKLKFTWIPFILSVLTLAPFYFYQKVILGGVSNRYFGVSKPDLSLALVLLAVVLVIIIMIALSKNEPNYLGIGQNIFLASLGISSGIFVVISSIMSIIFVFPSFLKLQSDSLGTLFIVVMITRYIIGIVSGIILFIMGSTNISGKNLFNKRGSLALLPTLWVCLRLIEYVIGNNQFIYKVADILGVCSLVFLVLFLFTQAKFFALAQNVKIKKLLYRYGFLSSALMLSYNSVNIFVVISSSSDLNKFISILAYGADLFLSFYIVAFLLCIQSRKAEEYDSLDIALEEKTLKQKYIKDTNIKINDKPKEYNYEDKSVIKMNIDLDEKNSLVENEENEDDKKRLNQPDDTTQNVTGGSKNDIDDVNINMDYIDSLIEKIKDSDY